MVSKLFPSQRQKQMQQQSVTISFETEKRAAAGTDDPPKVSTLMVGIRNLISTATGFPAFQHGVSDK
ncbi:unnamed protein product [Gongylonema pulchrum]|uniref:Ovule protein n=1 Tax=Gongylonema pulchrum TaxID=637853 RepID=A0A183DHB0_9BILA|nr:unnamed protein product [Gongylonema pulchrum]